MLEAQDCNFNCAVAPLSEEEWKGKLKLEPGVKLELQLGLQELAPAVGQLSTLSADLSSIKFMFSLIERRNSSGARPPYQRGECQQCQECQEGEQSPLQLTLHRRRPMGRGGRGSSSGQTSALLPVLFPEMRDARCKMLLRRQSHGQDGPGDGDATIVKFQRKFIACIFLSTCVFFFLFSRNEIV